jgi:hypothetical protein
VDAIANERSTQQMMTAPDRNGAPALPKRTPRGLLPSTWLERIVTVEYVVAGDLRTTTGTLADLYPAGIVLNAGGLRTLVTWDAIAVVELAGD